MMGISERSAMRLLCSVSVLALLGAPQLAAAQEVIPNGADVGDPDEVGLNEDGDDNAIVVTGIRASLADGDHQFGFIVEVLRFGRIGDDLPIFDNGIGGFGEEKRRIAIRVLAHLSCMLGIVASDAEDPTHRETLVPTGDRQADGRRQRETVIHGGYCPFLVVVIQ